MLKRTAEGYVYISPKTNIQYALLEGMTFGGETRYTSDIIFIMLTDTSYNVDNNVVGYFYSTRMLKSREEYISEIVDEFETRNGLAKA